MNIARGLGIVCALAACAWFVLSYEQAHQTARAQAIITSAKRLTPAQERDAASALSDAGRLNPDSTVDILRAQLDLMEGRVGPAQTILVHVVHREPLNIFGWTHLAGATGHGPLFSQALQQIAKLDPRIP